MTDIDFIQAAVNVAKSSPDRSRKVGCIIVDPADHVRAQGCNDFPIGVAASEERHERPEKYLWIEHAERNAIYSAARAGVSLQGCRIYLPWFPCMDCARAIIQAGIVELIAIEPDLTDKTWGAQFTRALQMLREAGVAVRYVEAA